MGGYYKVSYGIDERGKKVDWRSGGSRKLVTLLSNQNSWYARHAARILQERCSEIFLQNSAVGDRSIETADRRPEQLRKPSSVGRVRVLRSD